MNVDAFVAARQGDWEELSALAVRAKGRPERLGADAVPRLGALYRSAAADLAQARRRFPGDAVVPYLDELVGRTRHLVYDSARGRESVRQFVSHGYWRRVLARRDLLLLSVGLLALATLLGWWWAQRDPGGAAALVPGSFRSATRPRTTHDLGISVPDQAQLASSILTNNIRVTMLVFAGGALAGVGTLVVLAYNGAMLGVVAGLASGAGHGSQVAVLLLPHGVLELSCIAVAATAGLRVGDTMLRPGRRARGAAIAAEARDAVLVVVGTAPWLVVAGLTEGFVTPKALSLPAALAVGLSLGAVYWALVAWRGRPEVTPDRAP